MRASATSIGRRELAIVDAASGALVRDGRVQLWRREAYSLAAEPTRVLQLEGSMLVLDEEFAGEPYLDCVVRCEAAGYLPLFGACALAAGRTILFVDLAARLRVRVDGPSGQPLPGIALELMPPRALQVATTMGDVPALVASGDGLRAPTSALSVDAPSTRVSDDRGEVQWSELPAGDGYRWAVRDARPFVVDPRHEHVRLSEVDGVVRTGAPPPDGVSGLVSLIAGVTKECTAQLLLGASIRGRVAHGVLVRPAIAKLCRINIVGTEQQARAVAIDTERHLECGIDGSFEFADVAPGLWIVRATWRDPEPDFWFACETCRLAPGESVDLGVLAPRAGAAAELRLSVVDQDGVRRRVDDVFVAGSDEPAALVSCNAVPFTGDLRQSVSLFEVVPIESTIRIHGLPSGRLQVWAQPTANARVDRSRVARIGNAGPLHAETDALRPLALDLVATMGNERRLLVRDDQGKARTVGSVWIHDRGRGRATSHPVEFVDDGGDGEAMHRLVMPAGDHELWVSMSTGERGGLCGGVRVGAGDDPSLPIVIGVVAAATVRGIARDVEGRPVSGATLQWTFRGWPSPAGSAPFSAVTDGGGRFVLESVPLDRDLVGVTPGTDLPSTSRGEVELVVRR